jgi:hypothetical protein
MSYNHPSGWYVAPGASLVYQGTYSDDDGDTLSYTAYLRKQKTLDFVKDFSLSQATGQVTWNSPQVGSYWLTIAASDGKSTSSSVVEIIIDGPFDAANLDNWVVGQWQRTDADNVTHNYHYRTDHTYSYYKNCCELVHSGTYFTEQNIDPLPGEALGIVVHNVNYIATSIPGYYEVGVVVMDVPGQYRMGRQVMDGSTRDNWEYPDIYSTPMIRIE